MRAALGKPARTAALAVAALATLQVCGGSSGGPGPTPTPGPTGAPLSCVLPPVAGTPALTMELAASGLKRPLDLQSVPDDCRLFVVEQDGRIRVVRDGRVLDTPFLDITGEVRATEDERGLLGLAFDPRYAQNGRLFVNYTDHNGDTHIAEFHADPAGDTADPASERQILFASQPFPNHNGGGLAFGPDGFLYIGLGDGGSAGDPMGNGQNLRTFLGKMLRIDVDSGSPYAVPADNPFTAQPGARPEIWAYGLRNPFRFSFDALTGDLLIGDVGQDRMEEVDLAPAARHGGENFGWNITEGSQCFAGACDKTGLVLPIAEYGHGAGCAVIGGKVYRGRRLPGYQGLYFFADLCTNFIHSFRVENGQAVDPRDWSNMLSSVVQEPTSFGVDAAGEVYVVNRGGTLYRIAPAP